MNKKKPIILAVAILLAIMTAVSASTFAWFTAHDEVVNRIETARLNDGSVSILEAFDPNDRLQPGVDINKDVFVINTGDAPAFVRVSFEEILQKLKYKGTPSPASLANYNPGAMPFIDYSVKDYRVWTSADTTHVPVTVNIDTFAGAGWAAFTAGSTPWDGFVGGATGASATALKVLTDAGVIFRYKQIAAAPFKIQWVAYAPLGTTPETYQSVRLDPEMFNLIRKDGTTGMALTDYQLLVNTFDPAFATPDQTVESNRNYHFLKLEMDTVKSAKWQMMNNPNAVPALTNFRSNTKFNTTTQRMTAATDDVLGFIELVFAPGSVITSNPTAADAGKWYYNQGDGFFYYLGVVEPGQTTPQLLDAITLSKTAGKDYSYMDFQLTVIMDAIQATKEAITSTTGGGWGTNYYNTAPVAGVLNPALITVLENLAPVIA